VGQVLSVAASPQEGVFASAGGDEVIKIWNLAGQCMKELRIPRPYEQMNIVGVKGITPAQKDTLIALGAIEREEV
jgi:WD40 repeat protein